MILWLFKAPCCMLSCKCDNFLGVTAEYKTRDWKSSDLEGRQLTGSILWAHGSWIYNSPGDTMTELSSRFISLCNNMVFWEMGMIIKEKVTWRFTREERYCASNQRGWDKLMKSAVWQQGIRLFYCVYLLKMYDKNKIAQRITSIRFSN